MELSEQIKQLSLTPVKNDENSSVNSSPSTHVVRKSTPLIKNIASLPPLRPILQLDTPVHNQVPDGEDLRLDEATPEKKPAWDSSFAAAHCTPTRLPWTPDIRMRKLSPLETSTSTLNFTGNNGGMSVNGVMIKSVSQHLTSSPRTPHVSQINVKRQKHISQLDRTTAYLRPHPLANANFTATTKKINNKSPASSAVEVKDGFVVPNFKPSFKSRIPIKSPHASPTGPSSKTASPTSHNSTNMLNKRIQELEQQVRSLTAQLDTERQARQDAELKLAKDSDVLLDVQMENGLLRQRVFELEKQLGELLSGVENATEN